MGFFHVQAANCKNCYRCIRACPVKAIEFRGDEAKVIEDACIYCCDCLRECPQNAKVTESDVNRVNRMLAEGEKLIVSLAPSFAGFTDDPGAFVARLYGLGFAEVRETAEAAAAVSKQYAVQYHAKGRLITTACPVVVEYVEKYAPHLLNVLAESDSPMTAHARWIKSRDPLAKVVFIGPCYAKKKEMSDCPGAVDAVLTFDEVRLLDSGRARLRADDNTGSETAASTTAKTVMNTVSETAANTATNTAANATTNMVEGALQALLYPVEGGIIQTTFPAVPRTASSRHLAVSGIENLKRLLSSMEELPKGYFLELNACEGGCMNGPASGNVQPLVKHERILAYTDSYARRYQADPLPMENAEIIKRRFHNCSKPSAAWSEAEIRSVLNKIGKRRKEDELNCGACGYSSCRDKAAAVLAGKAELYMCMPYAQARAESFAHVLFEKTPNAVIAVTDQLLVKEVNEAAESFYRMNARQLTGLPLDFLIDPGEVELSQTEQVRKKIYFPDLEKTAIVSASFVPEEQLYLVILHDLTEQEQEQAKHRSLKQETVLMAQRVIENQMRVAQEIAGLLGETTAETKVTLTKMKKLLLEE